MSSHSTLRIILTAMFAALICVATMFIRIPTPGRSFRFSRLTGAILCELFMVAGYLLYESLLLSYGAGALASVPANLAQGAVGVVIGMALTPFFTRSHDITELLKKME